MNELEKELCEALEPFAKILNALRTMGAGPARTYADLDDDYSVYRWHAGTDIEVDLTLGDVRRAVAVLEKARGQK